jgi:hypothetical protein
MRMAVCIPSVESQTYSRWTHYQAVSLIVSYELLGAFAVYAA